MFLKKGMEKYLGKETSMGQVLKIILRIHLWRNMVGGGLGKGSVFGDGYQRMQIVRILSWFMELKIGSVRNLCFYFCWSVISMAAFVCSLSAFLLKLLVVFHA